ncbi:MAG: choline dehydrogenase [Pseudomonadota bacterium]
MSKTYDYIIVGSGPAGCVLARRLSEDPDVSVLILEAGGPDRHPYIHMPAGFAKLTGGRANWGYSTTPQEALGNRDFWYPQGKVLGGGSSINAQIYTRGNARDYDEWSTDAGCQGWSYQDVLPYFRRAEDNDRFADDYHGNDGPLGVSEPVNPLAISKVFLRAAQQAGLPFNPDFNGAVQEGCGYYQMTQRNAKRCSAAVGYLRPVLNRPNLTLKTGVLVTKVAIENGRAVGVEHAVGTGTETLRCEREVLVTAGAIGSPKLLLMSGIGPAEHLKDVGVDLVHALPGVGENLQDHMDVYVVNELIRNQSYDHVAKPHHTLWAGLQYVLLRKGPVASNLIDAGGFWYADKEARSPDIQFHFVLGSGLEHGLEKLKNDGVTLNSAFLRPRSRGSVRLASADPTAAPLIDPNYWGDPYDREMSIRGFKLTREIMAQPAFEPFIRAERLPGPDVTSEEDIAAYATKHAKTDYHPVGTCKMGVDELAVVDPELRVRGLEGLRVCDSSIMPLLVSSNTNAPTTMIGEKAADHIKGVAITDRKRELR